MSLSFLLPLDFFTGVHGALWVSGALHLIYQRSSWWGVWSFMGEWSVSPYLLVVTGVCGAP